MDQSFIYLLHYDCSPLVLATLLRPILSPAPGLTGAVLRLGGGLRENVAGILRPWSSGPLPISLDNLGDNIGDGRLLYECPGDGGGIPGEGGAMIPSVSLLRIRGRMRGRESIGKILSSDLNREDRGWTMTGFDGLVGVLGSPERYELSTHSNGRLLTDDGWQGIIVCTQTEEQE